VLKVVHDGGSESRWPSSPDPAHPYYWRREVCAYESGLAARFGAPAVRAVVERADGSVALWLEDVREVERWTPELLGEVARLLGAAQAAPPPDDAWLARDWLRMYLRLHEVEGGDETLDRLDGLAQTVCHNDSHPANVLAGGAPIDWAYCGLGAAGLDAGVLVADGVADGAIPPEQADEAVAAVLHGYLDGLGGAAPDGDVRYAFAHGTALRLSWLPRGRKPEWDATIDLLHRLASKA
jgi:Phosphotransferase enzyme family